MAALLILAAESDSMGWPTAAVIIASFVVTAFTLWLIWGWGDD